MQQCSHNHGHQQQDSWLQPNPGLNHHPQIVDSRVTVVSVSTSSSMSNQGPIDWEAPGDLHHGRCHRDLGGPMKINLLVFKDEDTKDAVTYQSWHAGIWQCPMPCWVLRLYPSPLCHLLPTGLSGRADEECQGQTSP